MPMSRRCNSNCIVCILYIMICFFKLAGRAGTKGPVRDDCFQRPLHPTERASIIAVLMACEFYRGNVN